MSHVFRDPGTDYENHQRTGTTGGGGNQRGKAGGQHHLYRRRGASLESCVGEWVLVYVGFAMSRISEEEAAMTLDVLTQLGEAQSEMDRMRESGRTEPVA